MSVTPPTPATSSTKEVPTDLVDTLNVAARLPRTEAEGPGTRYALWVQGCPLRCPGCCNPHMLEFRPAETWRVADLADEVLKTDGIEGITFIGGEPFAQAASLTQLAHKLRPAGLSVMVFSGFTLAHIQKTDRDDWNAFLEQIDLLVDGPYLQEKHVTDRRWIGSSNQKIHFLTDRYAHLSQEQAGWDPGNNTIELRLVGNQLFINGFPHQDITQLLKPLGPNTRKRVQPPGDESP